jgi:hypothetical protein
VKGMESRFWPKVRKAGADECWLWLAARLPGGYGVIGRDGRGTGYEYAHRFSWMLANGRPVPEGMCVRHACDNRACVNPAHLLIGTTADNVRDMAERNRCARAKLSVEDVRWVREWGSCGWTQRLLGLAVGCNQRNVSAILRGRTRAHV